MKSTKLSAALAGLSLLCGTAFAQSGPGQAPEIPGGIILELQPGDGAVSLDEQAILGMLLMQLLATLEAEGENAELEFSVPRTTGGVGI